MVDIHGLFFWLNQSLHPVLYVYHFKNIEWRTFSQIIFDLISLKIVVYEIGFDNINILF